MQDLVANADCIGSNAQSKLHQWSRYSAGPELPRLQFAGASEKHALKHKSAFVIDRVEYFVRQESAVLRRKSFLLLVLDYQIKFEWFWQ